MSDIGWFHLAFYGVAALIILFGLALAGILIWGMLQTDTPKPSLRPTSREAGADR
jgi:hypothetical protein